MQASLRGALTALAVGAGFLLSAGAQGATLTWDMSNGVASPGSSPGNTATITACGGCGTSISAAGFTTPGLTTPAALFEKNGGADEIGMGLTNDPTGDNEISGTNVVVVNFTNAIKLGLTSMSFDFKMNSSTSPDAWAVLTSSTGLAGSFSPLTSGSDESLHQNLPLANFYMFEATAGNVLLSEVSGVTAAVPEPSTWAMMLLGFLGLGFAFRQSRRKVSFA
jgi:hypothetical protein